MNFLCPSCKARYKISDEKLSGRSRARMNCKRCGSVIELVREAEGQFVVSQAPASGPVSHSLVPTASPPSLIPDDSSADPEVIVHELPKPVSRHQDAQALASLIAGAAASADHEWFVGIAGQPVGPLPQAQMIARIKNGEIGLRTQVWHDGLDGWQPLSTFPELAGVVDDLHAEIEPSPASSALPFSLRRPSSWVPPQRSSLSSSVLLVLGIFAAGALGFFLGKREESTLARGVEAPIVVPTAIASAELAAGGAAGAAGASDTAGNGGTGGTVATQLTTLDPRSVERTVSRYGARVQRACWQPAVAARVGAGGGAGTPVSAQVVVTLIVNSDGEVHSVLREGDSSQYPGLAECVEAQAKAWRFASAAEPTAVRVPFVFGSP